MASFGTAVFTAILNTAPLVAGAATAGTALGRFGATATRVGAGLTTAVSLPIIAVGAVAVQQSVKIEEAWNEVRATYNASSTEIEALIRPHGQLGQAVTSLSMKYGLARDEVIELLAKLSQMGFTGKDATDTLTQGLEFAVAAGLKLEDGLSLATAITNTFQLRGQNLTNTLRSLNVVENETAASGFDLMKALTRAGGAAQAMTGPTFTSRDAVASLAAGMAVLKANGQETARSADALRAIFQRIYTPTNQVQALFDKMGVSLKTAKGEIVPFPKLLQNLADNFHKLTPYEQMQFGKKSIGVEFGPLFRTLIADVQRGADGMSIYNNTLESFGDTAKGAATYAHELDVRQNSLKVALGKVKAAFGLLVDTMRPAIVSVMKPLAAAIAFLATAMSKTSPQFQKIIVIVLAVVAAIGPLVLIVGALIAAFTAVGGPVIAVVAAIAAIVTAFVVLIKKGGKVADLIKGALGTAWGFIKDGVSDLKDAFVNLMPYLKVLGALLGGALLAAIVVIAAAFRVLAAVIKFIAGIVGWFFQLLIDVAMWAYDELVGHSIIPDLIEGILFWFNILKTLLWPIIKAVWDFLVEAWNLIAEFIIAIMPTIITVITGAWDVIKTAVMSTLNVLVTVLTGIWNTILSVIQLAWTAIVATVTTSVTLVWTTIQAVLGILQAAWTLLWSVVGATLKLAWDLIVITVKTAIDVLLGLVDFFIALFTGDWEGAWKAIQQIAVTVWNAIKAAWNAFWTFLKSIGSAGLNFLKSVWTTVWNAIKTAASSIWNSIKAVWNAFLNVLKTAAISAWNTIKSIVTGAINTVKSVISNGIKAAKSTWTTAWSAMKNFVLGMVSSIINAANRIKNAIGDAINYVKDKINSVKNVGSSIGNFLGFSQGGLVPGRGTGDTVPAMLTPGEFVVTKRAVQRIGAANLVRANRNAGGSNVLDDEQGAESSVASLMGRGVSKVANVATVKRGAVPGSTTPSAAATAGWSEMVDNRSQQYTFQTAIYNPVAEKASDSVQRRVTRLADMGMFATAAKDGK